MHVIIFKIRGAEWAHGVYVREDEEEDD